MHASSCGTWVASRLRTRPKQRVRRRKKRRREEKGAEEEGEKYEEATADELRAQLEKLADQVRASAGV